MKGISLMLAALGLLVMISGCPAAEEATLSLDGVSLGATSEGFLTRYDPESGAESYPMWGEEGVLGIVRAVMDPVAGEPVETSVFMDSSLVGFTRMLSITPEDYAALLATMTADFGAPTPEPPAWAQESPFYEGDYQPVPEELNGNFWCNETAREMLAMIYSTEEGAISANLINLDKLNAAAEATMAAMAPPEMEMPPMDGEMVEGELPDGAVVPEDGTVPAEGEADPEAGADEDPGTEGEADAPEEETPTPEETPGEG